MLIDYNIIIVQSELGEDFDDILDSNSEKDVQYDSFNVKSPIKKHRKHYEYDVREAEDNHHVLRLFNDEISEMHSDEMSFVDSDCDRSVDDSKEFDEEMSCNSSKKFDEEEFSSGIDLMQDSLTDDDSENEVNDVDEDSNSFIVSG